MTALSKDKRHRGRPFAMSAHTDVGRRGDDGGCLLAALARKSQPIALSMINAGGVADTPFDHIDRRVGIRPQQL
jgi:hypothetical protein